MTPHNPKSIELFKALAEIDRLYMEDYFCWKSGGDADNGEVLMDALDVYFERAAAQSTGKTERKLAEAQRDAELLDFMEGFIVEGTHPAKGKVAWLADAGCVRETIESAIDEAMRGKP